jgi:hypothetical protein
MNRHPGSRFEFDHEVEPWDRPGPPLARPPATAASAALDGALARWSTEFVARYGLDHPDLATPEQVAQELRVAGEIARLFRTLTPAKKADPDALAQARARAAALISRELGLDPPVTLGESPEELALRRGRW